MGLIFKAPFIFSGRGCMVKPQGKFSKKAKAILGLRHSWDCVRVRVCVFSSASNWSQKRPFLSVITLWYFSINPLSLCIHEANSFETSSDPPLSTCASQGEFSIDNVRNPAACEGTCSVWAKENQILAADTE